MIGPKKPIKNDLESSDSSDSSDSESENETRNIRNFQRTMRLDRKSKIPRSRKNDAIKESDFENRAAQKIEKNFAKTFESQNDKMKKLFSKLGSGLSFPGFGVKIKKPRFSKGPKNRSTSHSRNRNSTSVRNPNSSIIAESTADSKKRARPRNALIAAMPLKSHTELETHIKTVTCLEFDKHCQRLVAGGNDHVLSLWDLESMNSSLKPFRTLRPIDGQPIVAVSYTSDQERMVVAGGGNQPKVLTRDGREIVEFVYGDQYLKDLKYTKGHTSNITQVICDPFEDQICYTSSMDGTLRVWDLDAKLFGVAQQLPNSKVYKLLDRQKKRLGAEQFCYLKDSKALAVFCQKGHFQIFDSQNRYNRPELTHKSGWESQVTSCVAFQNCRKIAFRSLEDGAVRIFDIRKLGRAEKVWHGIYNNHSSTGIEISPDQQILVTGRSYDRGTPGGLVFLDIYGNAEVPEFEELGAVNKNEKSTRGDKSLKGSDNKNFGDLSGLDSEIKNRVHRIYADNARPEEKKSNYRKIKKTLFEEGRGDILGEVSSGKRHVTAVKWPAKLNQIFVGWGQQISVFFDRKKSKKGIIPALSKIKTKKKIGEIFYIILHFLKLLYL